MINEKKYFGKDIHSWIIPDLCEVIWSFDFLLESNEDEKNGVHQIDYYIYEYRDFYDNGIKKKFDEAKELINICSTNKAGEPEKKAIIQNLKIWIGYLSFFYSLCYFFNEIKKDIFKTEMQELEMHILECLLFLENNKYIKGFSKYGEGVCFYKNKEINLLERLFIFVQREYVDISRIYNTVVFEPSNEYRKKYEEEIKNANSLLEYCATNSKKEVWQDINSFVIGYYCCYTLKYEEQFLSINDMVKKVLGLNPFSDFNISKYSFTYICDDLLNNNVLYYKDRSLSTSISNINELIQWINWNPITSKKNLNLKIAAKWIFQNEKPKAHTAYELFKDIKEAYGENITELPAVTFILYELMKKMTYNEFYDIFPKIVDDKHKKLAEENYQKYIGNFKKQLYPDEFNELKISERFNFEIDTETECKIIQSMMFFMIWEIIASLNEIPFTNIDSQIPNEDSSKLCDFSMDMDNITKNSLLTKIINAILPAVMEKKHTTACNSIFDKEKQVFNLDKEGMESLLEFSNALLKQMDNKNYIGSEGCSLYNKFECNKAVWEYKNNYPFQWYTSQCQEKLLNDLAKDFKLNAGGVYSDFENTVLKLKELKSFIEKLSIEDEYNKLQDKLNDLSKQKEFIENINVSYYLKIYFILNNCKKFKGDDLQKEWFEFYKLDINTNQNKYKELIKKTYKSLKFFSGMEKLYDFILKLDTNFYVKSIYQDLVKYLRREKSKEYIDDCLCYDWSKLKYILFLLENSSKPNAKELINELLEFQNLDVNQNIEKYRKLLKQIYNVIKNYPAILKDLRNKIPKNKLEMKYDKILQKLAELQKYDQIENRLSCDDLKIIHLFLDQYQGYDPESIRDNLRDFLPCFCSENEALKNRQNNPDKYKKTINDIYSLSKIFSQEYLEKIILDQIEKVQNEFNNHIITKKETTISYLQNIQKFLDIFKIEKSNKEWIDRIDDIIYKIDGTNIKICNTTVKDIISVLYPVLKNSTILNNSRKLMQQLHKIYAADNPFGYANVKVNKNNLSNTVSLIYNLSHYIAKQKPYAVGQINLIKEEKLKYLSTQEKPPNQLKNKDGPISFIEANRSLTKLEDLENKGTYKKNPENIVEPFITNKNRDLIINRNKNRNIWKFIDRGFKIPKFRQTLKPFISLYHCFDEIGDAILGRSVTCKFNDESDTEYDWNKPDNYRDANACNLQSIYLVRIRNSEEHLAIHGSVKNIIDEKYCYNLLEAFIDSYKYLDNQNNWSDNNIVLFKSGISYVKCRDLMRYFLQSEIKNLSIILLEKITPDNLKGQDLYFWEQNKNEKDIEVFLKKLNENKPKDLTYKDEYFEEKLFIERTEKILSFMYCSSGLSNEPNDFDKNEPSAKPLDSDFLDFYSVPLSLYLIYLTMILDKENLEEIAKIID